MNPVEQFFLDMIVYVGGPMAVFAAIGALVVLGSMLMNGRMR